MRKREEMVEASETPVSRAREPLSLFRSGHTVRGREEPFVGDEEGRYVATIKVVLSHRSPRAYADDGSGLRCVAERAASAAAAAYNFHDTRIVSASLIEVAPEGAQVAL